MLGELEKLEANLGGVADMKRQPDAMFVLDLRKEALAVREARRLGLPIVALVDTNCDPDEADYVIPGNDDAIRSCSLIVRVIAEAIEQGKAKVTPAEMAAPRQTPARRAPGRGRLAADGRRPPAEPPPGRRPAGRGRLPAEAARRRQPTPAAAEPAGRGRGGTRRAAASPPAETARPARPRRGPEPPGRSARRPGRRGA